MIGQVDELLAELKKLEADRDRLDYIEHLMLVADVRLERDWGYEIWIRKEGAKSERIASMPNLRA